MSLDWVLDQLHIALTGYTGVLVVLVDACRSRVKDGGKGPEPPVYQPGQKAIEGQRPPARNFEYVLVSLGGPCPNLPTVTSSMGSS